MAIGGNHRTSTCRSPAVVALFTNLTRSETSNLLDEDGHLVLLDGAGAVLVEHAERFDDILFSVCVLHLARHEGAELGEVNGAVAVGIDLVDHVLELSLGRVLAEGAHDGAELLGGDGAITVLVEEGEGLLELRDLLLGQLVSHCARWWVVR